jgi:hypothetical protein
MSLERLTRCIVPQRAQRDKALPLREVPSTGERL